MSGWSDSRDCPNCDEEMFISGENRPFDAVSGDCPNCGFSYHTQGSQMSLEELNDLREEHELKPLKKLPEIEEWFKPYCKEGMMIPLEKLKNAVTDIKADDEWVNDSHTKAEHKGVCEGLDMLVRHFEEEG